MRSKISRSISKKIKSEKKKKYTKPPVAWFKPQQDNGNRRFVRVVVTTQDDATIFIMLCDPHMPEYEIHNQTHAKIEYYQSGLSKDDVVKRSIPGSDKKAY
jgi:hypothetical protein